MKTAAVLALISALSTPAWTSPVSNGRPSRQYGHSGQGQSCPATSELATFDNIPTLPGVSQLSPVGDYDGLAFNSLDVLQAGVGGTGLVGLEPESGDQVAVNGLAKEVTTGTPSLVPVGSYKTFTLESLYFGCSVNEVTSVAGVPTSCTIAITAYLPGSTVAYQTINEQFTPQSTLKSNLTQAILPKSWQKMGKVDIAVVASATTEATTALVIDNVAYKLYKCD